MFDLFSPVILNYFNNEANLKLFTIHGGNSRALFFYAYVQTKNQNDSTADFANIACKYMLQLDSSRLTK